MTEPSTERPIRFVDLGQQQGRIRQRIDAAIAKVLDHGEYIMGPEIAELERQLAAFCGARHAITCGSGTEALLMALMAIGLRAGEAVVVPSFTFAASAEPVCLLGGIPIFADVREDTFNLDPRSLKAAVVTARRLGLPLRGVISVDLFGQPCDYAAIERVVKENELWLICDAAQSFGAAYRGRNVGIIGDITVTSFFPAKALGCYGDGGALFTEDDRAAEMVRSLRMHGQGKDKYDNVRVGVNGRMDTLQAAILLEKLGLFADEIARRDQVAAIYDKMLGDCVMTPVVIDGAKPVWSYYTIRTHRRGSLLARLKQSGVPAMIYYRRPLHEQPAYTHYPVAGNGPSTSHRLAEMALSLPMHPYLALEDQERVTAILRESP